MDPRLRPGNGSSTPPLMPPPLLPPPYVSEGEKVPQANAATAAYAASVRGVTAQAVAFYFRAPVKAFFRTRVDYLAHVRAIILEEQRAQAATASTMQSASSTRPFLSPSSWLRRTSPAVLATAIRKFGWRIVPDHVLPPLVANVAVGAILYTSYLHVLGQLHAESAHNASRIWPPPPPSNTLAAGFTAGALQSVVAAPLDAIQARYNVSSMGLSTDSVTGRNMWSFSAAKLREIGVRGVFAGWSMSFIKDGFGSALFFSTFEYLKAQGYYNFVEWYYGSLNGEDVATIALKRPTIDLYRNHMPTCRSATVDLEPSMSPMTTAPRTTPLVIKPHYALEPAFLLLGGVAASVVQQLVAHPLTYVQTEYWARLEKLDAQVLSLRAKSEEYSAASARQWRMVHAYVHAYQETWMACQAEAKSAGIGLFRWLYRGFWWSTLRQVPSTSAGLIMFELVRRYYGFKGERVRIRRGEYDIILD